ncbi:ABC transporter permease [Paenibacillus eucommiae]|uniref:Aldouronate transport system permease protein n=1 Tax=Paenibacillus eucommiae TaxID=1355755 RepID=A0ABS4IMJ1_9BACL|nr:ABC transporter permease subunit [Paenibacillus eucommiae]MBP1988794.1 putative aldouronate transport system permease protein [Paenibacillus eucommiae]
MESTVPHFSGKTGVSAIRRKKRNKYSALLWMLIPGLIYFFVFHYVPMYGVVIAFKDFKITQGIMGSGWAGFKYFAKAFDDPHFLVVIRNTLIISLYKLIFGFPAPIVFALLLNEVTRAPFKKVVQTVSYLPHFISWIVLGGIVISFFSMDGPVNWGMKLLGFEPVLMLADDRYFRSVLVVTDIFQSFGWGSIIYFAAIAGIDYQLYEASIIDGANRLQRAVYITIPMLVPVIVIMLILRMSHILDAGFDQIFNLYNPNVYNVSDIIDTYAYRKGLTEMEYSYSTAIGLFKSVVALVLVVSTNYIVKWIGGKEHTLW